MKGYYRNFVHSIELKGDEKVLDFGCGPGAASKFIAIKLEKGGGELTCFDISEKWISRAKKRLSRFSNVEYYVEDMRTWEEKDGYYDTVLIHFMLHDIPRSERPEVMKALARKMKTGASLIIREPKKEDHGIRTEEIEELMKNNNLKQQSSEITKRAFMGTVYTGLFIKVLEIE
jgi:ubiquinone/menaquinone biosynthesis C-methylase UbiE